MQAGSEHALEDHLERYAIGTLLGADEEVLEEHLLICLFCQERLTYIDGYVRTMRAAIATLSADDSPSWRSLWDRVAFAMAAPKVAWAGIAVVVLSLLLLASAYWPWSAATNSAPVTVVLQASRGGAGPAGATAPGRLPLELEADLLGLPPSSGLGLEVVNARGAAMQRASIRLESGRWSALLPGGLAPGRYWVRLRSSGEGSELLREYALRVE
jgi:hypothetical protein